jgi:dimethylhistidine N-methyltransferase
MSTLKELTDFHPETLFGLEDIIRGLIAPQKILPSKLFYDEAGSKLFDKITELPEYYLTRTEQAIMDESVADICARIGENALLVELGSGSSLKTRALLDHLIQPAAYIPVDISAKHLVESAGRIAERYPDLEVMPVCADYEQDFILPIPIVKPEKTVVYFPGSTVGNFHPKDVVAFFKRIKSICGADCEILIGVDMEKDEGILHRAYNDCDGITAAFNLNSLRHLNEVYQADFDLNAFTHKAFYNSRAGRIEMHLIIICRQTVTIGEHQVNFEEGENIWTESSYKYTIEHFGSLLKQAGFLIDNVWMDYHRFFSIQYLVPGN